MRLREAELDSDGKRIRSFEVAERAQISRSTVSRVLSGDPRISEATRERVLAAAAELGYRPNLIARGLKNQATGIVGVVVTELDNAYHAHALQLLIEAMGARRLAPLVFAGRSAEGAEKAIERLMSYQVDAVIALAAPFADPIVAACAAGQKPLVLMNGYDGPGNVGAIGGDNAAAGRMVADLLIARGGKRFGYLGGEDATAISRERADGFVQGLSDAGHTIATTRICRYDYDTALPVAQDLLTEGVDAVFCANDTLACALSDAARVIGGPRPLIVGYDNSALAARPIYDLTSVDHDLPRMIARTVETAQAMIAHPTAQPPRDTIMPFIVERGSTRPAPTKDTP